MNTNRFPNFQPSQLKNWLFGNTSRRNENTRVDPNIHNQQQPQPGYPYPPANYSQQPQQLYVPDNTRLYPNINNQQQPQPGYPGPPANYPQQPQQPYVPENTRTSPDINNQQQPQPGYPDSAANYSQQSQLSYESENTRTSPNINNQQQPQPGYPDSASNYSQQPQLPYVPENTRTSPNINNQQQPQPGYPDLAAYYPQQPQLPYVPGCPPGLEYLAQLDRLLIKQQVEFLEALLGFETCNQYKAFNAWGHHIFNLGEESGCVTRNLCAFERGFIVHVSDAMGREVMRFSRECRLCASIPCLGTPCGFSLLVEAPIGQLLGKVEQRSTCWTPYYHIIDANNNLLYSIEGEFGFCCYCNVEFKLCDHQGREVGMITKDWSGFLRELFTDATHFSVTFPFNAPPQHKALIMGAAVLIDFTFYEDQHEQVWSGL